VIITLVIPHLLLTVVIIKVRWHMNSLFTKVIINTQRNTTIFYNTDSNLKATKKDCNRLLAQASSPGVWREHIPNILPGSMSRTEISTFKLGHVSSSSILKLVNTMLLYSVIWSSWTEMAWRLKKYTLWTDWSLQPKVFVVHVEDKKGNRLIQVHPEKNSQYMQVVVATKW